MGSIIMMLHTPPGFVLTVAQSEYYSMNGMVNRTTRQLVSVKTRSGTTQAIDKNV